MGPGGHAYGRGGPDRTGRGWARRTGAARGQPPKAAATATTRNSMTSAPLTIRIRVFAFTPPP
ncbi:hypothetical protein D7M15_11785 [Streptomyces sp. Z26]|nr:hypothetical protein D7M15_11785 [Streptomyces sp. Z26]